MTAPATGGFPRSPQLLRGGLVQLDALGRTVASVVLFRYNPDTLTRTLAPRAMTGEPGDRLETTRLSGPPHETIKLEVELDATEGLEHPDVAGNVPVAESGLHPALAALELLITPTSAALNATDALFDRGTLEIAPVEAPPTLLVWGPKRVLPVQVTNLTITEEAFDARLNPIRAKASIEAKVLTTSDLALSTTGGAVYLAHRRASEGLAALMTSTNTRPLGFERLP